MQRTYSFKKYFIPSILFLLGGGAGFLLLWYIHLTFQIRTVLVQGASANQKKVLINLFIGRSSFQIHEDTIKHIIYAQFPSVNVKNSEIHFPSTLSLVIENMAPFAYVKTDVGYLAVSRTGVVVSKERSSEIPSPTITFYQTLYHGEYQTGQPITYSAMQRALGFISLLENEGYKTETVAIDSVDMIACKTSGFEVAFSKSRPVELQVNEVQQIFKQIKMGTLKISRLDLRFDKPVVQLPQK